jgi:hypothetical protein
LELQFLLSPIILSSDEAEKKIFFHRYKARKMIFQINRKTENLKKILFVLILVNITHCRQTYTPPNIKGNYNYLVVDGILIDGQDSTVVNLSRSQNINDSTTFTLNPETGATVSVVGANGENFVLTESNPGSYVSPSLNLNTGEQYRLNIQTANGSQYQSDTLTVRVSPPIDSVNWQFQPDGVHIFVTTHDPLNNTRYYRWKYIETWEYHSAYQSELYYQNGNVLQRDSNQMIYACWHTDESSNLLLGTSANLSSDLIYQQPLLLIPKGTQQISVEYSMLVKQYALNAAAYNFWLLLQQNTEQLGSLFDAQPSQLTGNIHNISNPNEPVLGYISASTEQQQRIFINTYQILTWNYPPPSLTCLEFVVPPIADTVSFYFNAGYIPIRLDYTSAGFVGYFAAASTCVDCTLQGGSLVKPLYWP